MTAPLIALPCVRIAVASAVMAAGLAALLTSAGFPVTQEAEEDVLIVDDSWLADAEALADAPAVVTLGSPKWTTLLPELLTGGWAALPADATPAELLAGVLGAAAGLAVLPPGQVGMLEDEDPEDQALSNIALTPRELDVLNLLALGLSNKRAARDLGVSESTIKFHVASLYSKLGVQSRAGAVARGMGLGLVSV
ncbi:helix-turn-helix transcriptional regulator [Deinococcus arenicola]|uniref:Response regulator transcription factor n=1 Tax=Deinococcus arenicola TaxID=2994950 RepID=A0ABU4DN53_9DEIO|nr:response regulator transcription factor [Deinococcus sp. ZS9-10]MDV6373860.1 response regulator transcription factor [Deinococcus sp. ZS9-10]